jgi:hypothetical protein
MFVLMLDLCASDAVFVVKETLLSDDVWFGGLNDKQLM